MYEFTGFSQSDFDIFLIPEFHERMSALRTRIRPKLAMIGDDLAPRLESVTGHEMYPHTASHARRRINPPDDTWVAFSRSERAYKRYAHFEVGISLDGVFIRFSVKPESDEDKLLLIHYLSSQQIGAFNLTDPNPVYYYHNDHGDGPQDVRTLTNDDMPGIINRTRATSRGFATGIFLDRDTPILKSAELVTRAYNAIAHLSPLYRGAVGTIVRS